MTNLLDSVLDLEAVGEKALVPLRSRGDGDLPMKAFSGGNHPTFSFLMHRSPPMSLRHCLPEGLWIIRSCIIPKIALKPAVWLGPSRPPRRWARRLLTQAFSPTYSQVAGMGGVAPRFRTNMAQARQPRPNFGLGFQVKSSKKRKVVPASLGSCLHLEECAVVPRRART